MFAKIFQPAQSAMQSGRGNSQHWTIEFPSNEARKIDPLTGLKMGTNMMDQVELKFDTLEDAIAYAKKNNIAFKVIETQKSKRISRSYADNFAYDRKAPWTH